MPTPTGVGKGKAFLNVYAPADLKRRLERVAKARSVTLSKLVISLLEEAIDHEEQMVKAVTNPVLMGAVMHAMSDPAVMSAMLRSMRQDLSDAELDLFRQQMDAVNILAGKGETPATQQPKRKGKKQ